MARYRLLVGQHIGPDMREKADVNGRRPSRTYVPGDVVDTDTDLVKRGGPGKFQRLGGGTDDPTEIVQTSFPGGQVSSGWQQTTSGPDGKPISGPLSEPVDSPIVVQAKPAHGPAIQSGDEASSMPAHAHHPVPAQAHHPAPAPIPSHKAPHAPPHDGGRKGR